MRYSIVVTAALCAMLMGADCLPLFVLNNDIEDIDRGDTLGITVQAPSRTRVVPSGSKIDVQWVVGNVAGGDAIVDVLARSREDFTETIIEGGIRVTQSGQVRTTIWDTKDFPRGEYGLRVKARAGDQESEADASGAITIDEAPSFVFTEPFEDTELADLDPNDDSDALEIVIRFSAGDPEGAATARIGIDPGPVHTSGNEIFIAEVSLAVDETLESVTWDGTDLTGANVDPGTYNLFAIVEDGVNEDLIVDGLARVIVPVLPVEPNESMLENALPDPNRDLELLEADDEIRISFTLNQDEEVLIDLAVDQDENHTNANEIRILRERLIDPNTTKDVFDWNGDDADGDRVPDGIYQIIMFINTGAGAPTTVENDALIFVRSEEDQALISLLQPATDQERQPGAFLLIQWRDEDPSEEAKIRLTIDDDDIPAEMIETGEAEREILADREADGDGVLDSFQFQVPADLAPGRYTIFAYIDRDDMDPPDMISTAAGQLDIPDPNE